MAAVKVEEMEEAAMEEDSAVDLAVAKVEEMEAEVREEEMAVDLAVAKVEEMEAAAMEEDSAVAKVAARAAAVREEVMVVVVVAVAPCTNSQDHCLCCHTQIWLGTTSHHRIYQSAASLRLVQSTRKCHG